MGYMSRLEIIQALQPNFDKDKLLGHIQDGGRWCGSDSCQRTCTFHIFMGLTNTGFPNWMDFSRAYWKFVNPNGKYIRHPEKGYTCGLPGYPDHACWNDPTNFSGDQGRALIVALQVHGFRNISRAIFIDTLKNFSLFPNKDICFLAEYGALIRGSELWVLYPLLFLCDMWLCITNAATVLRYFSSVVKSNLTGSVIYTDGYINGLLLSLSTRDMPTPFGWLARKIIRIKLQDAWDYYFRHEGAPQLNLFIPLIIKYL